MNENRITREKVGGTITPVGRPVVVDAEPLRTALARSGKSVRAVSDESGVSASVIYRLRKGRRRQMFAEPHTVRELARVLGVDPEDLIRS